MSDDMTCNTAEHALRPFWAYYGGKWRIAKSYPAPKHRLIIEPFAGAAGYSTRHYAHDVLLVDASEHVCGVWSYIIGASRQDILALPDCMHVDDVAWPCQEAKWLAGFWLNKGSTRPGKRASAWMRGGTHTKSFWGAEVRLRIAAQSDLVRHWKVIHGDYRDVANRDATWFIDPPYCGQDGRYYKHNAIDYAHLSEWCKSRIGQVIVCEQMGADWLPFSHHRDAKASPAKSGGKVCREVIWTSDHKEPNRG